MPFSRYLQSNERDNPAHDDDGIDHHTFSTNVHFQLPNLIFNAPSVPPGGGAEALPAGLYPPSSSLSWFSHSDPFNSPLHYPPSRPAVPVSAAPNSAYHPPSSSSASPHSAASSTFATSPVSPVYASSPSIANQPPFLPHLPLSIPPTIGLPIYSSSGFDLLALLTRVHTRPFPKVYLGPVDLSCSFVVTDTRRFDSPIVYASPAFLKLTGYDEREVIGHNCRFLQSPGGILKRGDDRLHTSRDAVAHMRKNILADKECQVNLVNYRKDGSAFINMVSVIPLKGGVNNSPDEAEDVVYHIGFQVDLTEQPKSILSKLKDGSYVVNYSDKPFPVPPPSTRDWRSSSLAMRGTSKDLRSLLSDPVFTASFPLSTTTHASTAIALSTNPPEPFTPDPFDGNKPLHMFLLDSSPDFLLVVSLKGAFLYVAPAVRRVLGYDPDDLVSKSLSDFCHPADCVPLMRELKEASITPGPSLLTSHTPSATTAPMSSVTHGANLEASAASIPRSVVSYCRILDSSGSYVWIELRGKLHVEPGKGRKAIILSCRLRNMPHLEWGPISRAGGLVPPLPRPRLPSGSASAHPSVHDLDPEADERPLEREFWGLLSTHATFLYVGAAVRDVLAWGAGEVMGKPLADFISGATPRADVQAAIEAELAKVLAGAESSGLACDVQTKDGATVSVHIVFYRSRPPPSPSPPTPSGGGGEGPSNRRHPAAEPPIACQIKLADAVSATAPSSTGLTHPVEKSVFEEAGIDRSSSWQYELQQVKFKNQRLAEEIAALEAANAKKLRRKQASSSSSSSSSAAGATPSSRPAAGSRMAVVYAPPAQQSLNVRFVSGTQGGRPTPSLSSRAHPNPNPTYSSVFASTSQLPRHPLPPLPPPLPPTSSHPQRDTVPLSPMAGGYEQQQQQGQQGQLGGEPVFAAVRVRQSTESSLQGWSAYLDEGAQAAAAGAGAAAGVGASQGRAGSYGSKRSWDGLLRDPGGGGA